ncbi:MAG: VCBS repeat-containing protein [Saprospiraceae bacterium]|nr:VCBS repeat-containing protein [Saprospiraceae bacterium]
MTMLKYSLALIICFSFACNRSEQAPPLFQLLRKDATGLEFENVLRQSSEFNVFNYMYFFNGGGVGAGDFNNDGLVDLYFTNNMGPNKMFLNEGNMKFKDVTEQAGVAGQDGWTSGICVVDINNDGLLDLYVGQLGEYQSIKGRNQLFICKEIKDGIPIYEDEAIYYGLDLTGFSTQAVFFDYDLDGDLDMFQLNHTLHQNGTFGPRKNFVGKIHQMAGDKLFRNDNGKFIDVTQQAGIHSTVIGYGLGIITGDVNNDGWPDIYIGNDFHENDYLYINQGDGTFRESMADAMMHTSQFSMGVDMADVNNDGWTDIISLDMLPEDPYILKTSLGEDDYNVFQYKIGFGYYYQYTRNNLQLNNGIASLPFGKRGESGGTFSEIGLYTGIAATDWSWSPLFMDFDCDGYKDLFVSNGIPRRMNDIDYVKFQENRELGLKQGTTRDVKEEELSVVDKMPKIKLPNKFYRNTGRLTFDDLAVQVKNNLPTFSNGAIYADLDNDGDLDLVVNNLEDEPYIYKNLLQENATATSSSAVAAIRASNSFLSFIFKGQPGNIHGIGTKILIYRKNGERQVEEFYPVRGYQSSAHIPLHIGIGDQNAIDSVVVIWPDRSCNRVLDLKFNTLQTLAWRAGLPIFDFNSLQKPAPLYAFSNATATTNLNFQHAENPFVEFNRERLIPHMVSSEGPALAIGDINGDGLEDVFFGSSKRKKSALFLQRPNGTFHENTPLTIQQDSLFEDVDACFVDIDNDGDLDLVIAAGGNEYRGKEEAMKQRAYLNDGKGNFTRADPFPSLFMTASCVLPADFNGDGLMDFFFGGRAIPWNYGFTPNSYLMLNKGNGVFEEVTQQIAPGLQDVGLVKNGAWADLDGDGDLDLLLAMEWEPLTVFLNNRGRFEKKVLETGKGWWNFVLAHDFDGDGDVDILAGNLGENAKFKPSPNEPVRMYVNDFDDNGQVEQILTYYLKGREIPFANHAEITKQLPNLKKKYLYAANFAKATVPELLGKEKLAKSVVREADHFKSTYFENTGNFTFKAHPLPDVLQFSTLNAAALHDFDGDGKAEVMLGGNFYDCNIEMGRYDANYGNVLTIGKNGMMEAFPMGDLIVKGQVRRIRPITIRGETFFVLARNNMATMVVQPKRPTQ